jgi:hypothetical protein
MAVMRIGMYLNTLVCSPKLQDRLRRLLPTQLPTYLRDKHVISDAFCSERFAYLFDKNGDMTTILTADIERALPEVVTYRDSDEDWN